MNASERSAAFQRLRDTQWDLLVLGGGITGAGIARDAALRGLRVCLVDKGDLACGTSSASSKLIHGGLRYLEQFEFGLVREGVRERALLMRNAPHLARPLPFVFPVYEDARVSRMKLQAGMWAYDLLAGFGNYRRHSMLNRKKTLQAEPALNGRGLRGSALYYDCLTDDARLTLETALDAESQNALILTYAEVTAFTNDGAGRTVGAEVRDVLLGDAGQVTESVPVRAKVVAVAAGAWTDEVLGKLGQPRRLRPTKGSHLVVDVERLPVEHAVVLTHPADGRVMFAIPWGQRTVIGTTDTDEGEPPDDLEASGADVDYMLAVANHYFPRFAGDRADVISTWSGLRPLMGASDDLSPSEVSREHMIFNVDPGLLAIAGGKLTTYRKMAEEAVDRVLEKLGHKGAEGCATHTEALPGACDAERGWLGDLEAFAQALCDEHAIDLDVARHLTRSYGWRAADVLRVGQEAGVRPGRLEPGLPFLVDEVAYAARHEQAQRLEDVLRRRTLIFLQAKDQGWQVADEAARVMGGVLGWDEDRIEHEVSAYRARVEASRAWQNGVHAAV